MSGNMYEVVNMMIDKGDVEILEEIKNSDFNSDSGWNVEMWGLIRRILKDYLEMHDRVYKLEASIERLEKEKKEKEVKG